MFIIIIGTRSAGKSAVKEYLLRYKDFKHVRLVSKSDEGEVSPQSDIKKSTDSPVSEAGTESSVDTIDAQQVTVTNEARDHTVDTPASFLSMASSVPSTLAALDSPTSNDADDSLTFSDPSSLLGHVTHNWRENFVTEDVTTRAVLEPFLKRPFVFLVSVDAPTLVRYNRHKSRYKCVELENFIEEDDTVSFGPNSDSVTSSYLFASYHLCHVNIINSFPSVLQLHVYLDSLNLLDPDRLRPGWDSYFMKLASLASHRSNCMRRRVGAILTRDHTIIATGYNGTPRGLVNCNQGGCKRCNEGGPTPTEGFEECLCIHAEENALLEAGRERVGKGAVLYCNTCPCLKCTIKIVQNGVSEVVYNLSYKMDKSSAQVFKTAGVKLRQYSPPK